MNSKFQTWKAESRELMNISNLKGMLPYMSGKVYWKNRAGVYLGCNNAMGKFLGMPKSEVLGKTDYDLAECLGWPKEVADKFKIDDAIVMLNNTFIFNPEEILFADSKGNLLKHATHKIPLRDVQGKIIGMLGSFMDIADFQNI